MTNEPVKLITRYLSNEATPEEQEELLDWVSASAENQRLFHQYVRAWNQQEIRTPTVNKSAALQSLNARIDILEQGAGKHNLRLWLKVAAVITLLAISSAAVWKFSQANRVVYGQTVTETGQRTTIRLSDGSTVRLNVNTRLRYPKVFQGATREIFLDGEAFFEVTHNPRMPFVVHTQSVRTEVLGTSFNIDGDSATVAVTVASGKVKVSNPSNNQLLLPSERIEVNRRSGLMTRSQVNLDLALAWTRNTLKFENATLSDVANALEDWYGIRISLEHTRVGRCRITGTYRDETLTHILEAIAFSTDVRVDARPDGTIVLSGKGCDEDTQ